MGALRQDILTLVGSGRDGCLKTGLIVDDMIEGHGYEKSNVYNTLTRMVEAKQLTSPERGRYCLPKKLTAA